MNLWKRLNELTITKKLRFNYGATINVVDAAGAESTVDLTEFGVLDVVPGTATASKAVVLDASKGIATITSATITTLTCTSAIIGGTTIDGTDAAKIDGITNGTAAASKAVVLDANLGVSGIALISGVDDVSIAKTITSATPSTERLVKSALTLTPATTMAVAGGGSLAGVRGEITLTTGKSFTEGFLYGAQGKVTMNGTLAEGSAARITGVLGQTDLSTGTLTLGQVSAIWGDLQGNPTLTVNDQLYVGRFTNSMSSGKKAQAFQLMYGAADFFVEASADGGAADWCVVAAVGGSQSHKLKISVFGTTFYIPLHTA